MEEEDLRLPSPLFSSDPEPLPESTRSSSASSAVTVDNTSKDFSHHSSPSPFLVVDQSAGWTDQQHSLYLSSLEASFVNELHRSMRLRGWSIQTNADERYNCRTSPTLFNMHRQSLALQDGCQKLSLERVAPLFESTADSHVLAGSQSGFTSIDKGCTLIEPNSYNYALLCDEEIHIRGNSAFTDMSPTSLEKQSTCYKSNQELICSTTEVTDQNFTDEEARSSCMPMVKRLKTATADGSSSDQVVSFGKSHTLEVSNSSNSTSENIGHEGLSEPPESYDFPKYDLPYFLKGR